VSPRGSEPWTDAVVTNATERLRFEAGVTAVASGQAMTQRLIADLAARFVVIQPEAIDDAVVDCLRQVADALQLDRAILWHRVADDAYLAASHFWLRDSPAPVPERLNLAGIPFIASRIETGEVVRFTRIDEVSNVNDRETCLRHGLRSAVIVPMMRNGGTTAEQLVLTFSSSTTEHEWTTAITEQLRLLSALIGQALTRQASLKALQHALDEVKQLRERATEPDAQDQRNLSTTRLRDSRHAENLCLRREVADRLEAGAIVGRSQAIRRVLEQAQQVAVTDSTVLLLGETGTGKELLATYLHELSARHGRGMVRVNCGAIPSTLIESELFGRERGAFTGALSRQIGRFELADRSTIFLDEIGDLPPDVQVKLLRVLEERQIERLGSPKAIHVDVRIIAATHQNLEQRIVKGVFREDLFYRLNVFPIQVPALRDRAEDIPLLVWRFVDEFAKAFGKRIDAISRENMAALQRYAWPGNIRELRNVVERAMIVATGPQLNIALPSSPAVPGKRSVKMADVERDHIRSILEGCGWRIRGTCGAAELLGFRPTTLETRMAKLGITRPKQ